MMNIIVMMMASLPSLTILILIFQILGTYTPFPMILIHMPNLMVCSNFISSIFRRVFLSPENSPCQRGRGLEEGNFRERFSSFFFWSIWFDLIWRDENNFGNRNQDWYWFSCSKSRSWRSQNPPESEGKKMIIIRRSSSSIFFSIQMKKSMKNQLIKRVIYNRGISSIPLIWPQRLLGLLLELRIITSVQEEWLMVHPLQFLVTRMMRLI